jgi:hypothetical protein
MFFSPQVQRTFFPEKILDNRSYLLYNINNWSDHLPDPNRVKKTDLYRNIIQSLTSIL